MEVAEYDMRIRRLRGRYRRWGECGIWIRNNRRRCRCCSYRLRLLMHLIDHVLPRFMSVWSIMASNDWDTLAFSASTSSVCCASKNKSGAMELSGSAGIGTPMNCPSPTVDNAARYEQTLLGFVLRYVFWCVAPRRLLER